MIQKPFPFVHNGAVVATDVQNDEMYGAAYQTLLWASIMNNQFSLGIVTMG